MLNSKVGQVDERHKIGNFLLDLVQMYVSGLQINAVSNLSELICSWAFLFLAIVLVSHCITFSNSQNISAVTNSRTTLLEGYGPTSKVLTTLESGEPFSIYCRVSDALVYDDPWWLRVSVAGVGDGWVADYYADCGYIGYCEAPLCI